MKELVAAANEKAVGKLKGAQPFWVDVVPAREALGLDKKTILHAGPPIQWQDMCGPMRGAVLGALKYEGLAETDQEAEALAASGEITFEPCHHHQSVGPMTGIISSSMPLLKVENRENGNCAYSSINEGAGDVIRFGAYGERTVQRLKWMETVLAPALKATVLHMGGVNLKNIIAQALNMGDELHMRNNAATDVFVKTILAALTEAAPEKDRLPEICRFLTTSNDQFFLNFAMAACKAAADAAHGIPYSTMVTAIARNGVNIGVRISGLGDTWFTAPAARVDGLYFAGFSEKDANPDIGDSAIMETGGVGGCAIAAAPAIVRLLGTGSYQDAIQQTMDMYEITLSESEQYAIPNLDFRGSPIGIDMARVVETGITPIINTAIASREPGVGMVGAGIAKAPMQLFTQALLAYGEKYGL